MRPGSECKTTQQQHDRQLKILMTKWFTTGDERLEISLSFYFDSVLRKLCLPAYASITLSRAHAATEQHSTHASHNVVNDPALSFRTP